MAKHFIERPRVYLLSPILDDPRFEGFDFGDEKGVLGGTIDDDFLPKRAMGHNWHPANLAPIWKPFSAIGRVRPFNDFPCVRLGVIPAFSQRAVDNLRDILEANGELLPFDSNLGTYYAYNVTTMVSALDRSRSEVSSFKDGWIIDVRRYELLADNLSGLLIFRLQEYPRHSYVTDKFVRRVQEVKLKGFDFQRIWPLPRGTDYRKLHKDASNRREKAELPRGRTLKCNSVLIGLILKAQQPTEAEKQRVEGLMDELDALLVDKTSDIPTVGNLEGHEYNEGECWLSISSPDADALVATLRPWLETMDWSTGLQVLKRYGEYYQEDALTAHVQSLERKAC
jgi:hypothetical protein